VVLVVARVEVEVVISVRLHHRSLLEVIMRTMRNNNQARLVEDQVDQAVDAQVVEDQVDHLEVEGFFKDWVQTLIYLEFAQEEVLVGRDLVEEVFYLDHGIIQ
jgi:hypothetical protein